jgi:aldose 1-epimerase
MRRTIAMRKLVGCAIVCLGIVVLSLLTGCHPKGSSMKETYGTLPDGRTAELYTLVNANGLKATLTNYGAILVSIEVPDREGNLADVTLGYDTLKGWLTNTSYFGSTVGRYGNRIAKGKFTLDGKTYTLATNNDQNHLHGGIKGFDKVLWDAKPVKRSGAAGVEFTYTSADGEEGYPGNLKATVTYLLTDNDELRVEFKATTDKPTIVNLVHHSYWNLTGDPKNTILDHELMLAADRFLPVDETLIPTGELRAVKGTPFDFTQATKIGARVNADDQQLKYGNGYDHCWVLRSQSGKVALAATLHDPSTGRAMDVLTDQPGVQFYGGNFLDGTVTGKGGVKYEFRTGLCLETQHYPDSPNKPEFPSVVLRPGETYRHTMILRFYVKK